MKYKYKYTDLIGSVPVVTSY